MRARDKYRVTVSLLPSHLKVLREISLDERLPLSALVRRAVSRYIQKHTGAGETREPSSGAVVELVERGLGA